MFSYAFQFSQRNFFAKYRVFDAPNDVYVEAPVVREETEQQEEKKQQGQVRLDLKGKKAILMHPDGTTQVTQLT